ncbi:MAG: DUF3572 domain-containing protein [Albidovulum sp.]
MVAGQDFAETVALKALAWLVSQEDMLGGFMGASGSGADELRQRAGEPEFLGSVLDYILTNDAWVIRFCDDNDLAYDVPMAARGALPGGAEVCWT